MNGLDNGCIAIAIKKRPFGSASLSKNRLFCLKNIFNLGTRNHSSVLGLFHSVIESINLSMVRLPSLIGKIPKIPVIRTQSTPHITSMSAIVIPAIVKAKK